MKLVEILAKELKEWADTTVCYAQEKSGSAYPWTEVPEFSCGRWTSYGGFDSIDHNFEVNLVNAELAEDYQTAIVTKEMWEAERGKIKMSDNLVKEFDPIYCRDRIKEIDALVESLEEERVSLVQALEDEGFSLIERINKQLEECKQSHEGMSDPSNWEEGDLIECIDGGSGVYTKGSLYTFIEVSGWGSIRCIDDTGRENGVPPEYFEWHSRPTK